MVGLKSNFTILDTDDQIRLIKQVLKADNIDDKRWPARALANRSMDGRTGVSIPTRFRRANPPHSPNGRGAALYKTYQARLKELNAVDFGDLLFERLQTVARA